MIYEACCPLRNLKLRSVVNTEREITDSVRECSLSDSNKYTLKLLLNLGFVTWNTKLHNACYAALSVSGTLSACRKIFNLSSTIVYDYICISNQFKKHYDRILVG